MHWSNHTLISAACLWPAVAAAALSPCHLPHLPEQVECGSIDVPENRAKPDGRRITIRFARIPAVARPAATDPLLVLAGGPGQAAMEYGPLVMTAFREVRKRRDVLLVDQRGTGQSAPLPCPLPVDAIRNDDAGAVQDQLRRCVATYGADLRFYHTRVALADFEDIRRMLGYRQVSLWGGSYGTRTALLYAKHYPNSIRAMVLDSVAPPDVRLLLSSAHSQAALDRLLADCAGNAACRRDFPSLARDLDALLARPPAGVQSRQNLAQLLRGALYVPVHASALPYAIHTAAAGDARVLNGLYGATASWSLERMSIGQTFSIMCTEEAPFLDRHGLAADAAGSVFGDGYGQSWREWCRAWPAATLDKDGATPVVSDVPTLLLAGGLDPVTPPANAVRAARTLRNSRVLIAPEAGHTFSAQGCAPHLIAAFLGHARPSAIDGACLRAIRRPPFVLANGQPTL